MKVNSPFRALVFCIVTLACCIPFIAFAQQVSEEYTEAVTRASRDASFDIDTRLWFAVGCMLGPLGIISAYVLEGATPPSSRFIGKSPEYVTLYTDTYKAKMLSLQSKSATDGCITTSVVSIALVSYWLLNRWGFSF